MISKNVAKAMNVLPESIVIHLAKKIANGYVKKHANIKVEGMQNIDKIKGPKIFVCNHLSNSDGLILNKLLVEKYDPYFIAGQKLSNDPVTNLGIKMVKTINIKPNSPDKEAITRIINEVKNGENILIFPEGTRSRTGAMIEAKKGILLIARLTKATIVPMGIAGSEILLPINYDGNMDMEEWHDADVTVKVGEGFTVPKKEKGEDKKQYEQRCIDYIMVQIAKNVPENYRGIYKEKINI